MPRDSLIWRMYPPFSIALTRSACFPGSWTRTNYYLLDNLTRRKSIQDILNLHSVLPFSLFSTFAQ